MRTLDWYPGGQIPEHILGTMTWGCLTFVISLRGQCGLNGGPEFVYADFFCGSFYLTGSLV